MQIERDRIPKSAIRIPKFSGGWEKIFIEKIISIAYDPIDSSISPEEGGGLSG